MSASGNETAPRTVPYPRLSNIHGKDRRGSASLLSEGPWGTIARARPRSGERDNDRTGARL